MPPCGEATKDLEGKKDWLAAVRVSVIGLGYLGLTHAVAMSNMGHTVVGIDTNPAVMEVLRSKKVPFFEPGLSEQLVTELESGRLAFTQDIRDLRGVDAHFICVGTPESSGGGQLDTSYVEAAFRGVIKACGDGVTVIGKSTVPVGTSKKLSEIALKEGLRSVQIVWNPEFLREGTALADSLAPDRLVMGCKEGRGAEIFEEVFEPVITSGTPYVKTSWETAELVKVAANSFLAMKISFINAIAEIADAVGADVTELADVLGHDSRIGRQFLNAGIGFGGGCLPKDTAGFLAQAEQLNLRNTLSFLEAAAYMNSRTMSRVVDRIEALFGDLGGVNVTILGAAFKPNSDDVRESPSLKVAQKLFERGANVKVHDPVANPRPVGFEFEPNLKSALEASDVTVVGTEWAEYMAMDPAEVATLVKNKIVIDGRNCLPLEKWVSAGWKVIGIGRIGEPES